MSHELEYTALHQHGNRVGNGGGAGTIAPGVYPQAVMSNMQRSTVTFGLTDKPPFGVDCGLSVSEVSAGRAYM